MKRKKWEGATNKFEREIFIEEIFISNRKARQILCPALHINKRQYKLLLRKLKELGFVIDLNHKGIRILRGGRK